MHFCVVARLAVSQAPSILNVHPWSSTLRSGELVPDRKAVGEAERFSREVCEGNVQCVEVPTMAESYQGFGAAVAVRHQRHRPLCAEEADAVDRKDGAAGHVFPSSAHDVFVGIPAQLVQVGAVG